VLDTVYGERGGEGEKEDIDAALTWQEGEARSCLPELVG